MSQSVTPIKKLRKKLGVRPIFFWGGSGPPSQLPSGYAHAHQRRVIPMRRAEGRTGTVISNSTRRTAGRTDGRTPGPPLKASMHRHQARRGRHCCDVSGSGANVDARFRCDHSTTTTTTRSSSSSSSGGGSALCRLQWTANDQTNYRAPADVGPPTWFGLHTRWAKTSGATDS